jgi:DNA-binding SARP family transcriptional activator
MQQSLVHFLNHGILPFVGRGVQVERIEQFWRQTTDSHGLRSLLLVGEAGVGKSRLVEEIIPRITLAGGAVIHAKLYPDLTTSVAPLFARALGRSSVAQSLLKSAPEETLAGVTGALVRITSLRPTLLVIEDIHLLHGDALREFAGLLDRLSDEPLSLLCAARPVELAARATLERFLVDEIELMGLGSTEIAELYHQVLGQKLGIDLARTLEQKTCGNVLALRSALRGALRLAPGGRKTTGSTAVGRIDQRQLAESLERNVRLLSEGMAAHLNDEEKPAAALVATLGEVFARETAMAVLGDAERAERILSQLLFKGVISTAISTSDPLDEHRSAHLPLAFTHSLLHRHFIEHGAANATMLLRVIAQNLPLYSVIPFQRLVQLGCTPLDGAGQEMRAFDRTLRMGTGLRLGTDWRYEEILAQAAEVILEACLDRWSEEERVLRQIALLKSQASIMQHSVSPLGMRDHYLKIVVLASDERYTSLRIHRLHGLAYVYWSEGFFRFMPDPEPHRMPHWLEKINELLASHPELKQTREYIDCLTAQAKFASERYGPIDSAAVERALNELRETPGLDPELARYAYLMIIPYFLDDYTTPEQMAARARMLAELEEMISPGDGRAIHNLAFSRIRLLASMLRVDELLQVADKEFERARTTSSWQRIVEFGLNRMSARLLIDLDFDTALATGRELITLVPDREVGNTMFEPKIAYHLCGAAILAHDDAAIVATLSNLPYNRSTPGALYSQILALAMGDLHEVVGTKEPLEPIEFVARDLALLVLGEGDIDRDTVLRSAVDSLLTEPVYQVDSLMATSHVLRLLTMLPESDNKGSMGSAVVGAIRHTLAAQLELLASRGLHRIMASVFERFGRFLPKGEQTAWKSRVTDLRRRRGEERERSADQQKIDLTMFGAVTIRQPGGEPERVKGAQLCTLLGLMVADCLQPTPMSQREFLALAIGGDRDPDSARKSLNFAVFRLRELLGTPLAIETGGETPRLARDLVTVDFITASEALERASEALSEGALIRAVPEILESLRTSAGQVAYPALYEEFFEAAREDYETDLRRVALGVARALVREGDTASAEEVLTRAYEAMADDAELAELLQQVLVRQGKRSRAARISLRAVEEV